MPKPNLFKYATSELSQDAFLCWLIDWSNPSNKVLDPKLHQCAVNFVQKLLNKDANFVVKTAVVKKQWKKIDVSALINDKFFIVIEDKKGTSEHSDQLNTYAKAAIEEYKNCAIKIQLVYFKMEEQGEYKDVENCGYSLFKRKKMLKILKGPFSSGKVKYQNNIISDYYERLKILDNEINSYDSIRIEDWEWYQWMGFYAELQKHIDSNWRYVPNPAGGFLGFFWHWKSAKVEDKKLDFYLQLEQKKFVFKLYAYEESQRRELRDLYRKHLYKLAEKKSIKKIQFGRIGKYMGVAKLDTSYLKTDKNGILDLTSTIGELRKIEKLIDGVETELKLL